MAKLEGDFYAIWTAVSTELEAAVFSAKHPWHLTTLATVSPVGLPQARTMALRSFESSKSTIWFHTDSRSPKCDDLVNGDGNIQLLFYDTTTKRQLRCDAKAIMHHQDAVARMRWLDAKDSSRRCYLVNPAPSAHMDERTSTLPAEFLRQVPKASQAEPGYENFAAIECRIHKMDILQLNAKGGERCQLSFKNGNLKSGQWVAP